MADLWSPERDFQDKAIKEKLRGSTLHRYEHPHVSKRDLSDAVSKITEAVQVLFARAASNNQKQQSQRQYVSRLEQRIEELESRTESLAQSNLHIESQMQGDSLQFEAFEEKLKDSTDHLKEKLTRSKKHIDSLLRAVEKHERMILRNKVDIANGVSGGGDGDGGASLTVDQVFCTRGGDGGSSEGKDAKLVSLSSVLQEIEQKQSSLLEMAETQKQKAEVVEQTLPLKADASSLSDVDSKLTTVCGNLDHLLDSFHTAGILEQHPFPIAEAPPQPERVEGLEAEEEEEEEADAEAGDDGEMSTELRSSREEKVDSGVDQEESSNEGEDQDTSEAEEEVLPGSISVEDLSHLTVKEAIERVRETYKSPATGYFHVSNGMLDLRSRFQKEVDLVTRDTVQLREEQEEHTRILDTKVDIETMDKRVEEQFDKVIDKLDTAVNRAGEHEERFKASLEEIRDTCNKIMLSKADVSEVETVKKEMKTVEALSKRLTEVRTTVARKLDSKQAESMMGSFVPKEELRIQMRRMHQKLKAEISGGAPDEDVGFALQGKGYFSEEGEHHHTHAPGAPPCKQCKQRKLTIGQSSLFHAPRGLNPGKTKVSQDLSRDTIKLPELKRNKGANPSKLDQEGTLLDFADPGISQWSTGLLEPSTAVIHDNQGEAHRRDTSTPSKACKNPRPKTTDSKPSSREKCLAASKNSSSAQTLQRPQTISVEVHLEKPPSLEWGPHKEGNENDYYESKGDEKNDGKEDNVKVILGTDGHPAAYQLKPKEFGKDL